MEERATILSCINLQHNIIIPCKLCPFFSPTFIMFTTRAKSEKHCKSEWEWKKISIWKTFQQSKNGAKISGTLAKDMKKLSFVFLEKFSCEALDEGKIRSIFSQKYHTFVQKPIHWKTSDTQWKGEKKAQIYRDGLRQAPFVSSA